MTKLASAAQLWRINQAGRLQITDEPIEPITSEDAWELVSVLAADRAAAANGKAA